MTDVPKLSEMSAHSIQVETHHRMVRIDNFNDETGTVLSDDSRGT